MNQIEKLLATPEGKRLFSLMLARLQIHGGDWHTWLFERLGKDIYRGQQKIKIQGADHAVHLYWEMLGGEPYIEYTDQPK